MTKNILAIDPGNIESAYVLMDSETYKPIAFGKVENNIMLDLIFDFVYDVFVIEMIQSYGMGVGKSVFDTCVWIGRFVQQASHFTNKIEYIYRAEEKMNLCHTMKAKDSNIRQALIDRFGEVGTKNKKGYFYGFKNDIWASYAVGVTYLDKESGKYVK